MDPIKVLFNEHDVITEAIETAKKANTLIGRNDELYAKIIRQLLSFFRNYADQYHHHKEEEILFPEMNKKNELLEEGVIKEMLENHEHFRDMLADVEMLLDKKDYMRVHQQLDVYSEALLDHIAVEDDEVFQMAETLFDESELEKLFFRFEDKDRELGQAKKKEFESLLNTMKEEIKLNK